MACLLAKRACVRTLHISLRNVTLRYVTYLLTYLICNLITYLHIYTHTYLYLFLLT